MNRRSADLPNPLEAYCARSFTGHLSKIFSLQWLESGTEFISVAQDGKLIFWDACSGNKSSVVFLKSIWVLCCGASPDSSMVCVGGLENNCHIYKRQFPPNSSEEESSGISSREIISEFILHKELSAHSAYVSGCKFLHTNSQIVTASGDKSCTLWDVDKQKEIHTWKNVHSGDISCLSLPIHNSQVFLTGSFDGICKLFDARVADSNGICNFITSHPGRAEVNCTSFTQQGNHFVAGYSDGKARIFDIRSNNFTQESFSSLGSSNVVNQDIGAVAFSKCGRLLFVAGEEPEILVYDTFDCAEDGTNSKPIQKLKGHSKRVSCMELSPDGFGLLSGSWDQQLRLWTPGP
jgi:WD40 repeat protein